MRERDPEHVIAAFHEAALVPELWPQALDCLTAQFDSTFVLAQRVGADGYRAMVSNGGGAMLAEFVAAGWAADNPRMAAGMALTRRGFKGLIPNQMMMPAEIARSHPFEQEFAPRHDIQHEAGRVVAAHLGTQMILTIQRDARRGRYEGSELGAMNAVFDRLADACSLAVRAKLGQAKALGEAFQARGEALALLTERGFCVFHSTAFERLLGGRLELRGGSVHAASAEEDALLQALICRAAAWPAATSAVLAPVVLSRPNSRPVIVRCHPVAGAARDFLGLARVILIADDLALEAPPPAWALVSRAFGLTRAEARLAVRLASGVDLRTAAAAELITYESARTRLKAIFSKTGTARQHELALLIARLGG